MKSGKKGKYIAILAFLLLALIFGRGNDGNQQKMSSTIVQSKDVTVQTTEEPIKLQMETVMPLIVENSAATDTIQQMPGIITETGQPLINGETSLEGQAVVNQEASQTIASTFHDATNIKGRGLIDSFGTEPYYIDTIGYVSVYTNSALEENIDYSITPWHVPVYDKTEAGWEETGTIEHKTKIGIISQELWKQNGKEYQGYLGYRDLKSGEQGYINVKNYITVPYWEQNVLNAVDKGYGIAVFKQKSKYIPVYKDGRKAEVNNNTKILLPAKGSYYVSIMDRINYQIPGIVFIKRNNKMEPCFVFFNKDDLTLIY